MENKEIGFCGACGEKLFVDDKICQNCGESVNIGEKIDDKNLDNSEEINKIDCPYCGSKIKNNVLKCSYCGEWIDKSKEPSISNKINSILDKVIYNKRFPLVSNIVLAIVLMYILIFNAFYYIYVWIVDKYFHALLTGQEYNWGVFGGWYSDVYSVVSDPQPFPINILYDIGSFIFGKPYASYNEININFPGNILYFNNLWFILLVICIILSIILVIKTKSKRSKVFFILTIVSIIMAFLVNPLPNVYGPILFFNSFRI